MKSVGNFYALIRSVRDLNAQGIHQRWSFSLSFFDQRGFFSRIDRVHYCRHGSGNAGSGGQRGGGGSSTGGRTGSRGH